MWGGTIMTEKQKYYLWFALIVSICMTILMEIFQLYTLPVLGILELFMLVNVCMITVNLFIRKCVNHVETLPNAIGLKILVEPAADFYHLNYVAVVKRGTVNE